MSTTYNKPLILGAILSASAALLHIGCIVFGASWYRFFGAGEEMVQMAETGNLQPTIITSFIIIVLGIWSLYALSGAGIIQQLPLLRTGLCVITAIYLIRGIAFIPLIPFVQTENPVFIVISSLICCLYGMVHLIGLSQIWHRLK